MKTSLLIPHRFFRFVPGVPALGALLFASLLAILPPMAPAQTDAGGILTLSGGNTGSYPTDATTVNWPSIGTTFFGVGTLVIVPNGTCNYDGTYDFSIPFDPAFFRGEASLDAVRRSRYLAFPNGNVFGYFSVLGTGNSPYIYHFDMGYEYVVDANDNHSGVFLYDFKSATWFYTSPTFAFPYLYDFTRKSVVYYCPDPDRVGHYNTAGTRWFYDFATGQYISK